jgi:hypothetical protein
VRRHDLDLFSLLAGAAFLLAAVGMAVGAYTDFRPDARVVWSVVLIALGAGGVLGAMRAARREDAAYPDDLGAG